jgi:hypothetical protein
MFGLSYGKIIVTILVILAVWRAWKLWGPLLQRLSREPQPQPAQRSDVPKAPSLDLIECPHCGTYVPRMTACPSRELCRLQRAGGD